MSFYKRTIELTEKIIVGTKNVRSEEQEEILQMLASLKKKAKPNPPTCVDFVHKLTKKIDALESEILKLKEKLTVLQNDTSLTVKDKGLAYREACTTLFPGRRLPLCTPGGVRLFEFDLRNHYGPQVFDELQEECFKFQNFRLSVLIQKKKNNISEKQRKLHEVFLDQRSYIIQLAMSSKK